MRRARTATLLAGGLVLAACANGENGTGEGPSPEVPSPPVEDTEEPTEPEEPAEPTDPQEPPGPGELPGEAIEIYPYEDAELAVIGVEAFDVLYVREGPGVEFGAVAELAPRTEGLRATGHNRQLDDGSFWSEIETEDVTGWASTGYLSHLGQVTDITSEFDELPTAPSLGEVGQLVAQDRGTEEPPTWAVVIDIPEKGDLGEIVVDVIGFGDDAIEGERLHVFAVEDGDGYTAQTVEATLLCIRGVSEDGLCV